jgi:N-acetylglucosaminyldiphosphoundecaprenol N-acetyl-beta-D-mannosaminyltransferase
MQMTTWAHSEVSTNSSFTEVMPFMEDLSTRHLSLGGIRIDALELSDLIRLLKHAHATNEKLLILHHNLHSLYLHETSTAFRSFYAKAPWVYIDGLPIVWIGRAARLPITTAHRITFLDSFESILSDAARYGWRVFYLGSTEEVLTTGVALLRERYPQLTIGGRNGFFDKNNSESDRVIAEINAFRADILFVGMGMPVQEMWLAKHYPDIRARVVLTSGATMDYVTGHAYRPPAWAGRLGLYGAFRLFSDPKRLWRRYLIEPFVVAKHLALRLSGQDRRISN